MKVPFLALLGFLALPALPALLVAQSAASAKLVVPDVRDVTIKTRRTYDRPGSVVTTQVLYLKGARQRREERYEGLSQDGAGEFALSRSSWVYISQCDRQRTLVLNPDAKTYAYEPIEDPAARMARFQPAPQKANGPTVIITIDTNDTGERKRVGPYVARHVVTTRTTEQGPGEVTVDRQDGWYIDTPEVNCTSWAGAATMLVALAPGMPSPDVKIKTRGDGRRGYPIDETHHSGGRYAMVMRTELVDVSEAPLDDALFTPPPDFRAALLHPYGHYDLSKPDTILNRVQAYREVVGQWTSYILRHGLQGILPGTQPPGRY